MKIISNVILVFSLCSTLRYILIERLELKDYERIINLVLNSIQILLYIRIIYRFFKINH